MNKPAFLIYHFFDALSTCFFDSHFILFSFQATSFILPRFSFKVKQKFVSNFFLILDSSHQLLKPIRFDFFVLKTENF